MDGNSVPSSPLGALSERESTMDHDTLGVVDPYMDQTVEFTDHPVPQRTLPFPNDSFSATTMGNTPVLASTRPYNNAGGSAVENFLNTGVNPSQPETGLNSPTATATPATPMPMPASHVGVSNGSGELTLHDNSSFVPIPPRVGGATYPVAPLLTASESATATGGFAAPLTATTTGGVTDPVTAAMLHSGGHQAAAATASPPAAAAAAVVHHVDPMAVRPSPRRSPHSSPALPPAAAITSSASSSEAYMAAPLHVTHVSPSQPPLASRETPTQLQRGSPSSFSLSAHSPVRQAEVSAVTVHGGGGREAGGMALHRSPSHTSLSDPEVAVALQQRTSSPTTAAQHRHFPVTLSAVSSSGVPTAGAAVGGRESARFHGIGQIGGTSWGAPGSPTSSIGRVSPSSVHNTPSAFASRPPHSPGEMAGGLPRNRSSGEVHGMLYDSAVSSSPSATGEQGGLPHQGAGGGGARTSYARSAFGGGGRGAVSAYGGSGSSRSRPSALRATETSAAKPQWLSAVERMKLTDGSGVRAMQEMNEPMLPPDQSRLGLQGRHAQQQGMLTANQLRLLEVQNAGAGGYGPGLTAHDGRGNGGSPLPPMSGVRSTNESASPAFPSPGSGLRHQRSSAADDMAAMAGRTSPYMTQSAHSVAPGHFHATYSTGYGGNGAMSEQSMRRAHVRSGRAGTPRGVGSRGGTPTNNMPGSVTGGKVITASESTNAPASSIFAAEAHQARNAAVNTIISAEHKLSSWFHRGSPSGTTSPGLFASATSTGSPNTAFPKLVASTAVGGALPSSVIATGPAVLVATEEAVHNASTMNGASASPASTTAAQVNGDGTSPGTSGKLPGGMAQGTKMVPASRGQVENAGYKSEEVKKVMNAKGGDEDERDEHAFNTRNYDALHAIPWDQRTQLPLTGFGTRFFAILSSPRFWEKLDWAFRGSILTVLPTMVLSLEPATEYLFPMPSSLAFYAFWITMPTFGSGLRELVIALKGFTMGLFLLTIVVLIHPSSTWLSLLLLFICSLFSSFVTEEAKKNAAYVLASTIMQYISDPVGTNFTYIGEYYINLLISLAFGVAAFVIPFVRWSGRIGQHYIKAWGNVLSIDVQGTCSCFWVRSPLERELNVVRLRQLRATGEKCMEKVANAMDEADYEPHTGKYLAQMQTRFNFCRSVHNILGSMVHVIELLTDNPELIDTPMCNAFGAAIGDDLAIISSAMDSMILKIVDFTRIVPPDEVVLFQGARERFQEAVSRVREDVILTNENYETDESDVFLGFFLFSVDELCEVISNYQEEVNPRNNLTYMLMFPVRDVKSVHNALKSLLWTVVHRQTITRRMKEAIKLALCMTIPGIFQIYALDNEATSPMAGAAIIALVYNATGAESFHYASGRLLGTVLGSMASLLAVQISNGRRWVLYIFICLLSFIGAYVQAAPGFYALGNAIVCSAISITTQYQDQTAAMVRIQQNCFAILLYFAIASSLWPMRAHTKVKMSLDVSLRCLRESTSRMLRNLDMPEDPNEVTADVSALLKEMGKKISTQKKYIPGAVEEPTMSSAEYPEDAWKRIVMAEKNLHSTLSMMRFAYHTFMSSRGDADAVLSVHWVVLHRIAPYARDLSDLVYAAVDLYLLALGKTTIVPTTHLTKLRLGMMQAYEQILHVYILTIQHKVDGDDEDDDNGGNEEGQDDEYDNNQLYDNGLSYGSLPGPPPPPSGPASAQSPALPPTVSRSSALDSCAATQVPGPTTPSRPSSAAAAMMGGGATPSTAAAPVKGAAAATSGAPAATAAGGTHADTAEDATVKKKKVGYLSYNITPEEEAALRNFVNSRHVTNGTFTQSFAFRNSVVPGMGNGPGNGLPTERSNDAKLMGLAGADDDLAATLRKKHRISMAKPAEKTEEKGGGGDGSGSFNPGATRKGTTGPSAYDTADLENMLMSNASFIKNTSFFKNRSFLGSLFKRAGKSGDFGVDAPDGAAAGGEEQSEMQAADETTKGGGGRGKRNSGGGKKKDAHVEGEQTALDGTRHRRRRRQRNTSLAATSALSISSEDDDDDHTDDDDEHSGDDDDSSDVVSETSFSPRSRRTADTPGGHDDQDDNGDEEEDATGTGASHTRPLRSRVSGSIASSGRGGSGGHRHRRGAGRHGKRHGGAATMSNASFDRPPLAPGTGGAGAAVVGGDEKAGLPLGRSQPSGGSQHPLRVPGTGGGNDGAGGPSAGSHAVPPVVVTRSRSGLTQLEKASSAAHGDGDASNMLNSPHGAASFSQVSNDSVVLPNVLREGSVDTGAAADGDANEHSAGATAFSSPVSPATTAIEKKRDSRDSTGGPSGTTEKKVVSRNGSVESPALGGSTMEGSKRGGKYPNLLTTSFADSAGKAAGTDMGSVDPRTGHSNVHRSSGGGRATPPPQTRRGVAGKQGRTNDYDSANASSSSCAVDSSHLLHRFCDNNQFNMDGGSFEASEALRNLSFFDADKGEFILTNHDIHSLEAFLFGTRALVKYLNELEKALLEMHHASELAKKL